MTVLLQTRVENRVAEHFKRAARRHGKTPCAYLQQIVEQSLAPQKSRASRRASKRKLSRLPYNLVAVLREDYGE